MNKDKLDGLQQLNELCLTEDEQTVMLDIFDRMKVFEDRMQQIDTENVEVMVHVMPMVNVLREDRREQPFTRESLLEGAPEHTEDSWQVPRLVR
ncbi:MAG: Asp-tRNA(Asn)/Glu-tRNA(Gln) amidotransferase subunit GatC [Clostridia bacterium]|nr:Asp-tRNA(Asn)/Glu-tRNA(Gln) amidotransferase subunit GatC [Clostridia bacterium]